MTLLMCKSSWEVLTSVCTSNNICRQDKQHHLSGNSLTTSNNLILHHQYLVPELPLLRRLVLSAVWSTVARWELTINDLHHLNHGVCNTWQRRIVKTKWIQCLVILILKRTGSSDGSITQSDCLVHFCSINVYSNYLRKESPIVHF